MRDAARDKTSGGRAATGRELKIISVFNGAPPDILTIITDRSRNIFQFPAMQPFKLIFNSLLGPINEIPAYTSGGEYT